MKILFIGGTGSISTASSHLLSQRAHDVTLITRGNRLERLPKNIRSINADINDLKKELIGELIGQKWDCIVNWNVYTKTQALRNVQLFEGITRQYFFISSTAVYGAVNGKITERYEIFNTAWDYAISKRQAEQVFLEAHLRKNFPVTILRPGHTYCDFTIPTNIQGLGYGLIEQIKAEEKILMHNSGESLWTLTHSDDFALALVSLIEADKNISGEIFNVVSEEYHSWNDIFQIYSSILKKELNFVNIPSNIIYQKHKTLGASLLGDKDKNMVFDNSKLLRHVPEMANCIQLHEGLKRSVEWAENNREKAFYNLDIKNQVVQIIDEFKNEIH